MSTETYVVCGCKSWNRKVFDEHMASLPGTWHFVGKKEELKKELLEKLKPRYVFFLHWSWKVPQEIVDAYECINFHMTDLPFGRGGSPLQNLILRGKRATKLTAFRMNDEMDAGPIYLKKPLSLKGTAQEILMRSSQLAARMIEQMIRRQTRPVPQWGKPMLFKRRTPEQSRLPRGLSLRQTYDFIRMLDGEGYPPAFLEYRGKRYELTDAVLYDDHLDAKATCVPFPL